MLSRPQKLLTTIRQHGQPEPKLFDPILDIANDAVTETTQTWVADGKPERTISTLRIRDGTEWFYQFRPISLGGKTIWIGIYAPPPTSISLAPESGWYSWHY